MKRIARVGWAGVLALLVACGGPRTAPRSTVTRGLGQVSISRMGGLQLLQQRSARERTVAVRLAFVGGARLLSPAQEGLEALTLACVVGGSSADARAADIRQRLAELGARVSVEPGLDYSTISLHCLERHFAAAWGLVMGQVMSPAFDADEFEQIKTAALERLIRLEANPEVRALRRAREALLYRHPYIGTPEGQAARVAELTVDSVQAHYVRMLRPERLRIVTAGGLDGERLTEQLTATLSQVPQAAADRTLELPAVPPILFTDRPQLLAAETTAEGESGPTRTAQLVALIHAPAPATRAGLAFEIALVAVQRRLEADLCRRRSLTCQLRLLHEPGQQPYAALVGSTELPAPTIRAIAAQLAELKQNGLAAAEIESARAELLAQTYDGLQDSEGRARLLTRAWMQGQGLEGLGFAVDAKRDWRLAATAPSIWRSLSVAEVNSALQPALAEVAWCYVGDTRAIGLGAFEGR